MKNLSDLFQYNQQLNPTTPKKPRQFLYTLALEKTWVELHTDYVNVFRDEWDLKSIWELSKSEMSMLG